MGHIHALKRLDLITLEGDLRWHLQNNYYPPVPNVMIPIALKAVILCQCMFRVRAKMLGRCVCENMYIRRPVIQGHGVG